MTDIHVDQELLEGVFFESILKREKPFKSLAIRICAAFLASLVIIGVSIYYFVSISFKRLLTEHTTDMLEMVIQQAVNNVEEALDFGRKEVALMAEMFSPVAEVENLSLPGNISQDTAYLRTLFVTPEKVFSSDGGSLDVGSLPDIINAFSGSPSLYGPYYNPQGEFVIRWSAPIYSFKHRGGGVASLSESSL